MTGAYDVAVVGSGPGGHAAALTAARRGARVCLIEREAWGGVCLNVGCIPTKALLAVSHLIRRIQRAAQLGVTVQGYALEYPAVLARSARIIATLRRGLTDLLRGEGVALLEGAAAFAGPSELAVTREGATQAVRAQHIVLATGARPRPGPWAFDEQRVLSYRGLLALPQVPASLLIVGGGVIGCEFACCFSAFGTQVTLVEQQPQLLPGEGAEAVRWLARSLEQQGVRVHTGTTISRLAVTKQGIEAECADGARVAAERCLVAIGQQPNLESLRLDAAQVAAGAGIRVDEYLRTSQPHIAAIGDCLEGHGLAHWAGAEGALAARNLLGEAPESLDAAGVPRCTFTDPEIAHVGVSEADAGESVRASRFSFAALGRAHCDEETEGFVKLLVDRASDRIRAATIVGANASSLIHYAVLAMRHGLTAKQLARTVTAHPTMPEGVTEAAAHVYGESLAMAGRRPAGTSHRGG